MWNRTVFKSVAEIFRRSSVMLFEHFKKIIVIGKSCASAYFVYRQLWSDNQLLCFFKTPFFDKAVSSFAVVFVHDGIQGGTADVEVTAYWKYVKTFGKIFVDEFFNFLYKHLTWRTDKLLYKYVFCTGIKDVCGSLIHNCQKPGVNQDVFQ